MLIFLSHWQKFCIPSVNFDIYVGEQQSHGCFTDAEVLYNNIDFFPLFNLS